LINVEIKEMKQLNFVQMVLKIFLFRIMLLFALCKNNSKIEDIYKKNGVKP
jgi:hypothetical protein